MSDKAFWVCVFDTYDRDQAIRFDCKVEYECTIHNTYAQALACAKSCIGQWDSVTITQDIDSYDPMSIAC